jgi:hypothetical protein
MKYSGCGDECRRSLISMWPFTVVKCFAWLVSKESPGFWGCSSTYTEICYIIQLLPPVIVSLQYSTQKALRLQNPLFPIFWEDWTIVQECLYLLYYVRISLLTLDAGLLARSQYPEGPATGHLDTDFPWFPCVYKRMLRWFPSFQVATTFLSCSPPDLNSLVTFFPYLCTCKITTATRW